MTCQSRGRNMALESTQPELRMSARNISWGWGVKGGRCIELTTLLPSCVNCLEIWDPQPPGTLRACNGIALPFYVVYLMKTRETVYNCQDFEVAVCGSECVRLQDQGILLRQCKIHVSYPQTTHLTFYSYRSQNTEIASDQNASNL